MKYITIILLCCSLCLAAGCSPSAVTETDVSSTIASATEDTKEVTIEVAYNRYWTWSRLYDYLESPLQSGNLSFDANEQSLFLFAADGLTKITRWDAPLEDGMVARLYDQDGSVVRRFLIRITDVPAVSSQPQQSSQNELPSVVSIPDTSNSSSQEEAPKEKTVITMRGKSNKALKKAVDAFNKQSSTVSVVLTNESELFSVAGLSQEINTDRCPDLILMDYSNYMVAAGKGLLTPFNKADQEPFGLESSETVYGILLGKEAYCTAANLDVLYDCDVDLPEDYEDMIKVAEKVKKVFPDTTPLGVITDWQDSYNVGVMFNDLLVANGGCLLTPDYEAAALYSAVGVDSLKTYVSLCEQGIIAKGYKAENFDRGNTAFGRVSSKQYEQVFGKLARYNYEPLPLLLPNDGVGTVQSYYYCVPKNENKEKTAAAYEFLTYLMTDVSTLTALCKTAGVVPAHPKVRKDKYYQTDAWEILFDEADRGANPLPLDCVDTLYGYVTEAVVNTLNGEDPELALVRAKDLTERRLVRQ